MYLWLDLWDKRCWISILIEGVIIPKWIVKRHNLVNELKKIITHYWIKTIVVWLPYDLYWKDLKQLNKTKIFIDKLKTIFNNINIEWIDERYSSFEADYILDEMWIKNKKWKKDDISASIILETFLKKNNFNL